jgi:hypothetical protein
MGVTRTSFDGFQDQVCLGLIAFKLLIEGGGPCPQALDSPFPVES